MASRSQLPLRRQRNERNYLSDGKSYALATSLRGPQTLIRLALFMKHSSFIAFPPLHRAHLTE